ncbi:MAG: hypothetical protein VKL39_19970 [Leptolyngbyaceae bacterium]|nr:hypothetical protein [Leptolyngbyaceae bacterium]
MVYQLEPRHIPQHLPNLPCPQCEQNTIVQYGSLYACVNCDYRRDILEGTLPNSSNSKREVSAQKNIPPEKFFKPPLRLLIGTGAILSLAICIGGAFAYSHFKTVREVQGRLDEIYALKNQGEYKECESASRQIPASSRFFEDARALEAECRTLSIIEQAKEKASSGDYISAIETISEVPSNNPLFGTVEMLKSEWVQKSIELAVQENDEGNEEDAFQLLSSIPVDAPGYEEAQIKLTELQSLYDFNIKHQEAASAAFNGGNFSAAREAINQILPETSWWRGDQEGWLKKIGEAEQRVQIARENEQRKTCTNYSNTRKQHLEDRLEYYRSSRDNRTRTLADELRASYESLTERYENIGAQCSNLGMEIRDVPELRL